MLGPHASVESIPVNQPILCWRKAVWEMRGEATEMEARVIDDMLASGQNSTAASVSTHIPMTLDAIAAQVRRVRVRHPDQELVGTQG